MMFSIVVQHNGYVGPDKICWCFRRPMKFIYLCGSKKGGSDDFTPEMFSKAIYAIRCILLMSDIYSVSFEDYHFNSRYNTYQPTFVLLLPLPNLS